jgi:hypothetical protein
MQKWLDRIEQRGTTAVPPLPTGETCASLELDSWDSPAAPLADPRAGCHVGHFGPEHRLTPAQAWQAEQILRAKPPFRGRHKQQKEAARIRGIAVSVRSGRVGNSGWGRSMLATKGGNALRNHAPLHLQRIAPLGARAAQAKREGKKVLKAWEQARHTPQTYTEWQKALTTEPWEQDPPNFLAF